MRDSLEFSHFVAQNRRFPVGFSYKAVFTKLKRNDFCAASVTYQGTHKMPPPAMTFDAVSCLRGPDTAIHENSTFATSPNAAPAKKIEDAAAQSAALATKNIHAN